MHFAEPGDDDRLFVPVRGGCHVVEKVVRDAFRRAYADASVSGMRLHDPRHFAGHQTARVANLPETMKRLGHRTQTQACAIRAKCQAAQSKSLTHYRRWLRCRN